ncbi:MAG: histidinol dehydrogenase [Clostridia bacterium]|nr:histidinol dehydrogenase [Clostridia bacterium]
MKLTTVKADGKTEYELIAQLEARAGETDKRVTAAVSEILEEVRMRGDEAVRSYTAKFDGVDQPIRAIERAELANIAKACDPAVYAALERAAENIRDFHTRQLQQSWLTTKPDGTVLGQRIRGLARVGIYVPGGTAAYPSSVLMNAIPARIAGVEEIVMVTPPPKKGDFNADVMAAAYIAGVDRVFLCGGAQGIAAIAFGTETVPKVDKIVGPGNIYVATAKRLTYGRVDIDMIAGPSEILILADDTANPAYLAADLMSQAEHDRLASAILITTSERVAMETAKELEKQLPTRSRHEIMEESLRDYGAAIICRNMDEAVAFANRLAPEHLEVMCEDPMSYIGRLDNAGSVFLGQYAPEPLGDYYAGPNHVLPTGGTARFFSPLSVDSFLKKSSFIYYKREALEAAKDDILTLSAAEGLEAHGHAVAIRFEGKAESTCTD